MARLVGVSGDDALAVCSGTHAHKLGVDVGKGGAVFIGNGEADRDFVFRIGRERVCING